MSSIMDPDLVKVAAAVAVGIGSIALLVFFVHNKGRKRAERLGPAFELGTSRPVGVLGSALEGIYRGYSCRYTVQYASQYDRGGATLSLAVTSPHQWTAEVSKTGTRILARIGLVKDYAIGDRELDEYIRFGADNEEELRSIFGSEVVRDATHVLAAGANFESVRVSENKVDIKWSPRAPQIDEDPVELRTRLEYATTLMVACAYSPAHTPNR